MSTPIQLIVGLGNPGGEYQHTRHNAGTDWVEHLAEQQGARLASTPKFHGNSTRLLIQHQEVRLLVPTTYMNLSGQAVAALAQFYKIPPEAILVVHDELDLPAGTARLKQSGGHGGHNGLRSIMACLGSPHFARLRIGIGHPGHAKAVADYVLKRPPAAEAALIQTAINNSLPLAPNLCQGEWDQAVRRLHSPLNT